MGDVMILLVEGRQVEAESLEPALSGVGYEVYVSHTGDDALGWVELHQADLIVFDGASLPAAEKGRCRALRRASGNTPIVHTRTDDEEPDETQGADVYLVAPFTARKLLNRIRDLLPANVWEQQIVRAGDLILYLGKRSVALAGKETRLTPKLALLLEEFLRHPNQIRTRRELMQNVWQTDYVGDTRTLDVHIRWVREAIEEDPGQPRRLLTVRGVGYRLHTMRA